MTTYDFLQATDAKKPVYGAADVQWNRADSATFDGSRVMASADVGKLLGSKRASTVFVVVEGGTQAQAVPTYIYAVNGNSRFIFRITWAINRIELYQFDTSSTLSGSITKVYSGNILDKAILCFRNNGLVSSVDGGADLFINGISNKTSDADWNTTTSLNVDLDSATTYFGASSAAAAESFVGSFPCAPIIFDRALSDAEITAAFDTLWKTYGVGGWSYNGTTSGTSVADNAAFDLPTGSGTGWSIGGWCKLSSLATTTGWLLSLGDFEATPSLNLYLTAADNELYAQVEDDAAGATSLVSTAQDWGLSRDWMHILLIYDYDTTTLALYVNGTSVASDAAYTFGGLTNTSALKFGDSDQASAELAGYLRDWAKWDRALSAPEIAALAAGEYAADQATPSEPAWNIVMLPGYVGDHTFPPSPYPSIGFTPTNLIITNYEVTGTNQA